MNQEGREGHTLHSTSMGVDSFFSLIFSYFCFFVAAYTKNIFLIITHNKNHSNLLCNCTCTEMKTHLPLGPAMVGWYD